MKDILQFRKVPSPSHPGRSTVGKSTQQRGYKKHILKTSGHLSKAVPYNPLGFNDANRDTPAAPALLKECTVLHLQIYYSISKNNKYRFSLLFLTVQSLLYAYVPTKLHLNLLY
jgi:hypothetical protein